MADIPTPEQVEAIRAKHFPVGVRSHVTGAVETVCGYTSCGYEWPCTTLRLLAAYDALTAQNASLAATEVDTRAALLGAELYANSRQEEA